MTWFARTGGRVAAAGCLAATVAPAIQGATLVVETTGVEGTSGQVFAGPCKMRRHEAGGTVP